MTEWACSTRGEMVCCGVISALYLQFAQLQSLGRKIVQTSAALLYADLCSVDPVVKRLHTRLELLHLTLQTLNTHEHTHPLVCVPLGNVASLKLCLDAKIFSPCSNARGNILMLLSTKKENQHNCHVLLHMNHVYTNVSIIRYVFSFIFIDLSHKLSVSFTFVSFCSQRGASFGARRCRVTWLCSPVFSMNSTLNLSHPFLLFDFPCPLFSVFWFCAYLIKEIQLNYS